MKKFLDISYSRESSILRLIFGLYLLYQFYFRKTENIHNDDRRHRKDYRVDTLRVSGNAQLPRTGFPKS